ncbi:MAG: non-canonical purine NTP pyrophosphatase, partial [Candidatus Aminicenantales bacterium]
AELEPEEKNRVSHRGRALETLRAWHITYFWFQKISGRFLILYST